MGGGIFRNPAVSLIEGVVEKSRFRYQRLKVVDTTEASRNVHPRPLQPRAATQPPLKKCYIET